jgi:hypothetical protein
MRKQTQILNRSSPIADIIMLIGDHKCLEPGLSQAFWLQRPEDPPLVFFYHRNMKPLKHGL